MSTLAPKLTFLTWAPLPTQKISLFFKFCLQLQSPRFFRQIVQFQVIQNLLKKSKIRWKSFGSFWKMSLARWFWAFFAKNFLARKMSQNERIFDFLSFSMDKMESNKIAESFPTYQISAFEVW